MRWVYAAALVAVLAGCSEKGPDVDKIKKDITAEMNYLAGSEGQKFLTFDGVDAAPDGDKVKVTVKGVKMMVPQGEPLTIGDFDMHALAKGADQYEISDLHVPSKLSFKGPQGDLTLETGTQAFSGLWSMKYHTFLSGDGKFDNMKLSGPGATVDLAEMTYKSATEDKGNGVFDQAVTGNLKSMTVTGPEGSGVFSTGEFKSETKGIKLADLQVLARDWQTLVMGASEGKPADPALIGRMKASPALLASIAMHADLAGVSFKDASGGETFSLDHLVIDSSGGGFDQPKVALAFDLGLLGIKLDAAKLGPQVEPYKQFLPSLVKFGYALDDLPGRDLWSAWIDLMGSGAFQPGNEATAEAAAQGIGMHMVQLANQAGSAFRLTNVEVEAPAARLKLDGKVKADATSPLGAAGTANVQVTGLDAIADAAKQAVPPDQAAGTSGAFDMVRGFSNRTTTADNKVVDSYAIELTPAGKMTINGKPFDLFGAMTGAPQ
jgi:hypothetical protein